MGQQKNTVVINGKTYDAASGDLISSAPASTKLVSDFVPAAPKATIQHHKPKSRSGVHHLAHHKPQKSVTLKRSVAPKKKSVAVTSSRSLPVAHSKVVTAEASRQLLNSSGRHDRAKQIGQSSSISRFSKDQEPTVSKSHQPLEVKSAPREPISHHQVMPTLDKPSSQTSEDLFSEALSRADSHNQAAPSVSRRKHRLAKKLGINSARTANVLTVVTLFVVLGGFIAYQNQSKISMQFATSRSGLASASLPGYQPSGFSLNRKVTTNPGQIVLSFHSNSDDRAYTITQSGSNWNSQTLADNYLSDKQVEGRQTKTGKTVYVYNGSNATWVDGGIWYRIEGNSSLTSDQLVKIANSF